MRVLHIATLVSPDGAYGGPVRVAINQLTELSRRGHDVVLAAGHSGFAGRPPQALGGVPLRLFPVRRVLPTARFSGLLSTPMVRWLWRELAVTDVVHVHVARELVTLGAAELARRRGVPYVLQPHGMVVPSGNLLAGPLDALVTRRVLRDAGAVLCLTPLEREQVQSLVSTPLKIETLGNGVPPVAQVPPLPARIEVLFLSRLHARKRPAYFARLARDLLAEGVDASFVLVGADEGEGAQVAEHVAAVGDPECLRWEGPLDPSGTLERMSQASLLVLPSVDEPMPMAVIEAMSVGRPVVVTTSCGLADAVRQEGCGVVVDESYDGLLQAVRTLLADPARMAEQGARAAHAARTRFGMPTVADRLESLYERATADRG